MRILACADIHGSQHRLNLFLDQITNHKPDLAVICGDLTQFGPAETATSILNQIPIRTIAVPGNIDTPDVSDGITRSNAENIDHRRILIDTTPFIGLGGRPPTHLATTLIETGSGRQPLGDLVDSHTILVTHVPPYKTVDRMSLGPHGGNKGLRRLIENNQPRLVLSGHIHENPGVEKIRETIIVNCSIARSTEGALIDLGEAITVTMLD
jgi:uncharacterized protein